MSNPNFFSELKRRNVIRAAGLYLVGAWLLVQVASTVLPMFGAPDWLPRSIVILLVIGFVPALIFSWVFELTPQGLKRDEDVPPEQSIGPQTGRRMDRMIIVVLVLALAYFAVDKFVLNPHPEKSAPRMSSSGSNGTPNEKSVAVLAFANLSDDKGSEYFSDGISEELLTVLQKIPGLHVAARTSAFSFKGQNATAQEIGQKLGVAHLVEGSVRKAGDMVRIAARLTQATTGEEQWSENYTRNLKDVFAVQTELAQTIVEQLRGQLTDGAANPTTKAEIQAEVRAAEKGGTKNVEAHEAYLQGRFFLNRPDSCLGLQLCDSGWSERLQ
jgi:adenylate cyclase